MTTRCLTALAATLLATACVNATPADTDAIADVDAAAVPVASTENILGEWDIVSFEGYRPAQRLHGSTRAGLADFATMA